MPLKGRDCEALVDGRLFSRWFLQGWPQGLSTWHLLTKSLSGMLGTVIPEGKEENQVFRRDLLTIPPWLPAQKCRAVPLNLTIFVGNRLSPMPSSSVLAQLGVGLRLCFFPPYTPLLGLEKM